MEIIKMQKRQLRLIMGMRRNKFNIRNYNQDAKNTSKNIDYDCK